MSAEDRYQFDVCKASGRLRVGQAVDCGVGAAIDGASEAPGRLLTGVPGPLKYYARFLAVPKVYALSTVRALSVLGHPNVVAPIGVGGVDGNVFIVQELPEGELLDRVIQRGRTTGERLKLREVEQVLRHVVTALRHAHQSQIRHGSLGSSQIRVARQSSGELHVQVVDFGILPLLATHAPTVSVHEWHQLSPEQAAQPSNATVASDLFSLGVLLVEMLTGYAYVPPAAKMPWRELSLARPGDVRSTVARERPETPDAVLDLVASLLRARPEDRTPTSAMDLSRALARLSWEPRAEPSPADVSPRNAPRSEAAAEPARASTSAPSRSFVVSGASYSRPVPSQPARPQPALPTPVVPAPVQLGPQPSAPAPPKRAEPLALPVPAPTMPPPTAASALSFNDDETLSEVSARFDDVTEEPARAPSPRSWFTNEATVLTTQAPDRDDSIDDRTGPADGGTRVVTAPPHTEALADGTRIVAVPERMPTLAPSRRGFFRTEGTAVLAHPDQLAAPRLDQSVWEGARAIDGPLPGVPSPDATVPLRREALAAVAAALSTVHTPTAPFKAPAPDAPNPAAPTTFPLSTVESTMPDTAMPDPLRAAIAAPPLPRRPSEVEPFRLRPPPKAAQADSETAHPILIVLVVVAGGVVLGLVAWGLMHT